MDAMRKLVIENDVDPSNIKNIRVRAGSNILNPLRYPIASNELEAKFCPAFMVSAIALRRKAGVHEFNDDFVRSEPVQALMKKVECILDPKIEAQGWEKIRSTVEVDMDDGRTLVQAANEHYRGGPDAPFSREDLLEKFNDCASLVLSDLEAAELFTLVESLESMADIQALVQKLISQPEAGK
jgi:2-methylcitrate dehydratase PrpD